MTLNLLLFLFLFSFKNCYAFTEPLYEGSKCTVEGKPGVCKALADCPAEYHSMRFNNTPAKEICFSRGLKEVVCCETHKRRRRESPFGGGGFFAVRSTTSEINILCSFNGTLPVQCCPSDQVYAAPLQDAACPPPPPLEHTDDLIKRKCLEYSQYGYPCRPRRGAPGQFQTEAVCFQQSLSTRIVGGSSAALFEYPHMVMLGYKLRDEESWENGGTLISERAVLTAAHAVFIHYYGEVKQVCMGRYERKGACRDELRYRVKNITTHPQYRHQINYNDIAILHLERPVIINEYVRPACLPYTKSESPMKELTVTGWGLTSSGGVESNTLQKVTIDEYDNKTCAEKHPRWYALPQGWLPETMLCAGSMDGKDGCQGDSGGPLQALAEGPIACSYVVVGVVSSGVGCGIAESPGIYTRVGGFTDWIVKEIWQSG